MENEQFMENRQNYMNDNSMQQINVASAGDGVGVQAEVLSGVAGEIMSGKYDEHHEEHNVGDEDELKYVEEVQQSEKQQQQQLQTLKHFGKEEDGTYECKELAEKETEDDVVRGYVNENGGFVFGGNHQQQHDLFNMGNGHNTNGHDIANINDNYGNLVSSGFEEKLNEMDNDLDGFKNDVDFLSSSNVRESAECSVPQVDVKIEAKAEHQDIIDEEEPSSLATNTTNGTSSLSENVPPQVVAAPQTNVFDDFKANFKGNDVLISPTSQRPVDLDLEQAHSQLNPDAKEFIPSFGSNPASPTSPFAPAIPQNEPVLSEIRETEMFFGQVSTVPHHILVGDDLVAESPRKGKGANMDAVSLPRELEEFQQEAAKRPHELESEDVEGFCQRDDVMTPDQAIQQLPLDEIVTQDKENQPPANSTDYQNSNFMDHGPETSVDLDADLDMQPPVLSSVQDHIDVMGRSMYVASDDTIEHVLNSVQPIPTEIDSANNSFIDESAANQLAGEKELLQVEEKEHISHSPSTEEIQMNLQNTLNSSNKDIAQLPIDMDNAMNMRDSMHGNQDYRLQEEDEQFQAEKENLFQNLLITNQDDHQEMQIQGEDFPPEKQQDQQISNDQEIDDGQELNHSEIQNFHEKFIFEKQQDEQKSNIKDINIDEFSIEEQQAEQKSNAEKQQFEEQQEPHEQQLAEENISDSNELNHQLTQDTSNNMLPIEVVGESLLDEKTNTSAATDDLFDNVIGSAEYQDEIKNSCSAFKITDEVSNTQVIESLNFDTPINQEELNQNFLAVEKHLEQTMEQQLSLTGLEQQLNEMALNNTDGNLPQEEEIAAEIYSAAIEDITESLVRPGEIIAPVEQHEDLQQIIVDDSFNQHELECELEYEKELQRVQEMEVENNSDLVRDYIESPIKQQHQQELQSEVIAVQEPLLDAKQAVSLFTNEETEILSVSKTEEAQELPSCLATETTQAVQNETEILKTQEEQSQQSIEEDKTESIKEPEVEELKEKEAENVKEEVVATSEITTDVPVEASIAAATAAIVGTAAVAASKNKSETTKKPLAKGTLAAAKPKVASSTTAAKKPVEAAKKPIGLAAKPRTAPPKPTTAATEKKPMAKPTTATTAARKPLLSTTAATKVVAKTTNTTSTTRTLTSATKTTTTTKPKPAPRVESKSSSGVRKPATTNGPLAKPRVDKVPAKPTTLGLPGTNGAPKTKPLSPISPRSTLTSQVRKTTPATTAAKSPVKSSATNGVTKTASTSATRTKSTTTTVSNSVGTASKTFTARPAPKFISSSSTTTATTTAKRSTSGGSSNVTTTTKTTSSSPLRKSTPTKPSSGRTPTKAPTTPGGLKSKTPVTKNVSPATKPAPIRKPVDKTTAIVNGESNIQKELLNIAENQDQQASIQNGDFQAVQVKQQNGDSSIPMQTDKQDQSFLEPKEEQIPMDVINA